MLLLLYRNQLPSAKSVPLHTFKWGEYSPYYLDEETEKLRSFSEWGNKYYRNSSQIWVFWAPRYVPHSQDFCPRGKMFLHTWMNFEANQKKVNDYGTLTHVVTREDAWGQPQSSSS